MVKITIGSEKSGVSRGGLTDQNQSLVKDIQVSNKAVNASEINGSSGSKNGKQPNQRIRMLSAHQSLPDSEMATAKRLQTDFNLLSDDNFDADGARLNSARKSSDMNMAQLKPLRE